MVGFRHLRRSRGSAASSVTADALNGDRPARPDHGRTTGAALEAHYRGPPDGGKRDGSPQRRGVAGSECLNSGITDASSSRPMPSTPMPAGR